MVHVQTLTDKMLLLIALYWFANFFFWLHTFNATCFVIKTWKGSWLEICIHPHSPASVSCTQSTPISTGNPVMDSVLTLVCLTEVLTWLSRHFLVSRCEKGFRFFQSRPHNGNMADRRFMFHRISNVCLKTENSLHICFNLLAKI